MQYSRSEEIGRILRADKLAMRIEGMPLSRQRCSFCGQFLEIHPWPVRKKSVLKCGNVKCPRRDQPQKYEGEKR